MRVSEKPPGPDRAHGPRHYHRRMPLRWFDAHLDLAYLAVNGRDMLAPLSPDAGPHPPAAVTLPELDGAGVRLVLATIFTELGGSGPEGYAPDDAERAHRAGRAQLEVYLTWRDRGAIAIDVPWAMKRDPGLGEVRGGMGVAETVPDCIERRVARLERSPGGRPAPPLHVGLLIEGADPIRTPDELDWWVERGAAAVGMTWARGSRYASGNAEPSASSGVGLTALGRELAARLDELGIVHDASHLSDRALDDLLSLTRGRVIASHSNCRAIMRDGNQRHLTDDAIREIGRRGGVIGLNLVRNFIRPGLSRDDPDDRPTVDDAIRHVERVADIMGHRRGVGLGSDFDGGITARDLPAGIASPRDLPRLAGALAARGWSGAEVEGFAWRNWAEFWSA